MDLNTPVLGDMNVVNLYIPKSRSFNGTSQYLESDALSGVSAGSALHIYIEVDVGSASADDTILVFLDENFGGYSAIYVDGSGDLALYMEDDTGNFILEETSGTTITNTYAAIHFFLTATTAKIVMNGSTVLDETFSSETFNLDAEVWNIMGLYGGYSQTPGDLIRCVMHESSLDGTSSTVRARYQRTDNVGVRPSISVATDGAGEFDIWEREVGDIVGDSGDQSGNNAFTYEALVGP